MIALQAVTPDELVRALPVLRPEEARKVVSAVHRRGWPIPPVAGVRRIALEAVRAAGHVPSLQVARVQSSAVDPFRKLVLASHDGQVVEAVRIPLERAGRFSACVSSQVGCALACAFCATGKMGLQRNLEAWEIVEQVRAVRRTLDAAAGQRVHGVVFQGMGEPLANLDRVLAAIRVLADPCAQAIDARAMTVCTSGLPSGILRLLREAPRVRLGLSIGSAIAGDREGIMPIDASHTLAEVLAAAAEHARATRNAPMWAVALLEGRNDTPEHAAALADRALLFARETGVRPRISVIPYNDVPGAGFRRASAAREEAFRDALAARGVRSHKRYSGGGDIAAACGQLASVRGLPLSHQGEGGPG